MNNKKLILPTIALGVIIAAGAIGIGVAKADDGDSYPPVVERLAEQFGLKEDEVEAVFDSVRDEKHERMQASMEERLNQAVADGVITEEQKETLLNKKQEMFAQRDGYENNMREHKAEHYEEMEAWYEEQGIDHEALMQYMGFGEHKGFGRMHR